MCYLFSGGVIISSSSFGFDLKEVLLSAVFDPVKSPVASADFVNIFFPAIFSKSFPCFLTYFHIYFDLI